MPLLGSEILIIMMRASRMLAENIVFLPITKKRRRHG